MRAEKLLEPSRRGGEGGLALLAGAGAHGCPPLAAAISPFTACALPIFHPKSGKVGGKGLRKAVLLQLEEQRLCSAPRASQGGAGCWLTPVLPARQTLAPCALRRGAPGQSLPLNSFFRADSKPGETQARESSPSEQRLRQGWGPTPVICLLCPLLVRWDAQRGRRDAAKPRLRAGR